MKSPLDVYKKNQIQTAPPERLVLMLYDGAIKFITKAIEAIETKNIEAANNNLLRAQDIMSALMAGVNFEAGKVAEGFYALYDYMYRRLIHANIRKDKEAAGEVLNMIRELRDSWVEMLKANKVSKGPGFGEVTITADA